MEPSTQTTSILKWFGNCLTLDTTVFDSIWYEFTLQFVWGGTTTHPWNCLNWFPKKPAKNQPRVWYTNNHLLILAWLKGNCTGTHHLYFTGRKHGFPCVFLHADPNEAFIGAPAIRSMSEVDNGRRYNMSQYLVSCHVIFEDGKMARSSRFDFREPRVGSPDPSRSHVGWLSSPIFFQPPSSKLLEDCKNSQLEKGCKNGKRSAKPSNGWGIFNIRGKGFCAVIVVRCKCIVKLQTHPCVIVSSL